MALENATGEEESVEAQVDVARLAGRYLREKFEHGRVLFDKGKFVLATVAKTKQQSQAPIQADTAERISTFLGDKNWSRRKVSRGRSSDLHQ